MANILINTERCKGCRLCMEFCPRKLITMSEDFNCKGHHPSVFEESEECTGCAICAMMCPDIAIEVYK
jgi:2-oxoglutarate ferredoxin oxidoreductase subunit delta